MTARVTRDTHTSTHTSRAQATRAETPVHDDDPVFLEETGPLPEIPPRPGYTQRWIAVRNSQGPNTRRLMRAYQRGWRPRPPDSVGKAYQMLTVEHEGLGGVISTGNMALFERSEAITQKARAIVRERTRALERAIGHNLFAEHERLRRDGDTGFVPRRPELESRVERGQMRIAPDEGEDG